METSFLPTYKLKSVTTNTNKKSINIIDLSIWGKNQAEITQDLNHFIDDYSNWIIEQKQNDDADSNIGKNIISNLDTTLKRLKAGVLLLTENKTLFKAFQYTNTAMLLQFYLSAKNAENAYKDIENTDLLKQCPKCPTPDEPPTYHPFQLAFLLLSLESTINPESKYRKDVVDLIWFPTGGGKTEAYLAVAALTIIWRRMNKMNNANYQGVSVHYALYLTTFNRTTV